MTREILEQFQGKRNVYKIISNNGLVSYLTQSRSFADEASSLGASKLNTVEKENKHVLFLFNKNDEEVGRYYLGKRLQGKTPSEIAGRKNDLVFFDSWNPNTKEWVPCVGIKNNDDSVKRTLKTGFETCEKNQKETEEDADGYESKEEIIKTVMVNRLIEILEKDIYADYTKEVIYLDSFKGINSVARLPMRNNIVITRPKSYKMEMEGFKCDHINIVKNEKHNIIQYCSSDNKVLRWYICPHKVNINHVVPLLINKDSYAFLDVYSEITDKWYSLIGYKDHIYSFYYGKTLAKFICDIWLLLRGRKELDTKFDETLYNLTSNNIVLLNVLCLDNEVTNLAIYDLIMEWEATMKYTTYALENYDYKEINMSLTGLQKRVLFWDFILKAKDKNPKKFNESFRNGYQTYSEENLKDLLSNYKTFYKYNYIIVNSSNNNVIDGESTIMSALKNGEGDLLGF